MENLDEASGIKLPENPFTLGPVGPDLFAGRADIVDSVDRSSKDAQSKKEPRIIVITGPRGIGKTSFLNTLRARTDPNRAEHAMHLAVCAPLIPKDKNVEWTRIHDIIDERVVERLGHYSAWYKVLFGLKRFFRKVDVQLNGYGVKVSQTVDMEEMLGRFRKGSEVLEKTDPPVVLTILLDELDSLLDRTDGLADFIRSCAEHAHCPLVFLLAGLPPAWNRLSEGHPSFPRNARHLKLRPFEPREVQELVETATTLASRTSPIRVTLGGGVWEQVYQITGGHPTLVQILGRESMQQLLKATIGTSTREITLTKPLVSAAQTTATADFEEQAFNTWLPDLSDAQKYVLGTIAVLQKARGTISPTQLQADGMSQADTLEALTVLKDDWGLLDSDNRVISLAFLSWLRSQPDSMKHSAKA